MRAFIAGHAFLSVLAIVLACTDGPSETYTLNPEPSLESELDRALGGWHSIDIIRVPDAGNHISIVRVPAVSLYKLHNKSGGNKLIVMVPGSRTCLDCGWRGDPVKSAIDAALDDVLLCSECGGSDFAKLGRTSPRHVACRFCRQILGRDVPAFAQGLEGALFDGYGYLIPRGTPTHECGRDDCGGTYVAHHSTSCPGPLIDTRKHTIECALRYMVGEQETNQDDEPIAVPGHLPSESFVLEMDP